MSLRAAILAAFAVVSCLLIVGMIALLSGGSPSARPVVVPRARPVSNHAVRSPARPTAPAQVWAIGDGAAGTPASRTVAARIVAARPDRVLYLGDVYEAGTRSEFRRNFAVPYKPLLHRMAPTPGNHDWPDHRVGYDPFWRSVTGKPTPPWYSFEIGGWHVLSLNSETAGDPDQMRWLRSRIASLSGTCTLAFWHRPRFSAGPHGDQPDLAPLWNALVGHATLVVSGHDHDFQRLKPIDGITQLVDGSGGRSHYLVRHADRRLAFGDDTHYGALRLNLAPGRARIAFITAGGKVLDHSSVRCTPGA